MKMNDHHFIRQLFLLKNESNFYDFETSQMRCHSKPQTNLDNLYVFGVLTGQNCIRKIHLRNGRLSLIEDDAERQRTQKINEILKDKVVVEHFTDEKYNTGVLIKVVD